MSEAKYIEIEQLDLDLISISPEEDETLPTNPDLDSDQYGKAKASDIPTKQISALTIHVPDTLSKQVSALQLPDATAKHITNNHTIPLTQIQESGDDTSISSFSSDIETKPNSMTIVDRTSPKKK
jgi:hypothetical protein